MDHESLRLLIRHMIQDRRLLHDGIKRVWSRPSDGETCDACGVVLASHELLMEGFTLDLGRKPFKLHVRCFRLGITRGAPSKHLSGLFRASSGMASPRASGTAPRAGSHSAAHQEDSVDGFSKLTLVS